MERFIFQINKYKKLVVIAGFFVFLFTGLNIYKDYGVGWDEEYSRTLTGKVVYDFIANGDAAPYLANTERYHGPLFETILYTAERISGYTDTQQIYYLRHLLTFLLFYVAAICFYFLLQRLFKNTWLSLLGVGMLIISPRIFADIFYNTKDLAFLSFYIFASLSFYFVIKKRTLPYILLHALLCAWAIDVRITAIIIPMLTVAVMLWQDLMIDKEKNYKKLFSQITVFSLATYILMVVFWPVMWLNPVEHFARAFLQMSRYGWNEPVLFMGKTFTGQTLPRYYSLVWMAITIPITILLLTIAGLVLTVIQIVKCRLRFSDQQLQIFSQALLFIAPVSAVVILHSTIYDGWRHLYFTYPGFIVVAIYVLNYTYIKFQNRIFITILSFSIVINLLWCMHFIYTNHPHEMVYFNRIAGTNAGEVGFNYEQDYWGLSYRNGLEHVAHIDSNNQTIVQVSNFAGMANWFILDSVSRQKIIVTEADSNADYFISNYRFANKEYNIGKEVYNVYSDGCKILTVRKMK